MHLQSGDRRLQRSAASRTAIVDAAQALLARDGAEGIQVETVAEMAEMSVQTIYNRVGKRSQLLLAVAERAIQACSRSLSEAFSISGTPTARATAAAHAYMRFALEHPAEFQLLANPSDDDARDRIAEYAAVLVERMAAVLAEGQRAGEFILPSAPAQVAVSLWAMMDGIVALSWRSNQLQLSQASLEETAETAVQILLAGLRG